MLSSDITANTDSLTTLLTVYDGDTNRVRVLNKLADLYLSDDYTVSDKYAQEAMILAKSLNDKSGIAESLFILTYKNIYSGATNDAITSAQQAMDLYQELGNQKQVAFTHNLLGYMNQLIGKVEKAKDHYQSCIDISRPIAYKKGLSMGLGGLGNIFETNGDFAKALNTFQESFRD